MLRILVIRAGGLALALLLVSGIVGMGGGCDSGTGGGGPPMVKDPPPAPPGTPSSDDDEGYSRKRAKAKSSRARPVN